MIAGIATREALRSRGDSTAVMMAGSSSLSGLELDDRIARLSTTLLEAGLGGKRVGIRYLNSLEALEAHLALERIGATRVPVDPGATDDEAGRVFDLTDVAAVVTDAPARLDKPTLVHSSSQNLYDPKPSPPAIPPENQVAVLFVRGVTGSTLISAPMTYANWEASISHNTFLYRSGWYGEPIGPEDCFLTTQQLMHGSSILGWMPFLRMGLPQVIVGRFSARPVIEAMTEYGVTSTFMVPAMITRVVDALKPGERIPSLVRLLYGGAPMSISDMRVTMDALGPVLIQLYGKWEGGWPLTVLDQNDHRRIAEGDETLGTSCGRSVPGVELSLRAVPDDRSGEKELWVRSPMVIQDYADPDGWYQTADLAACDDRGYHYLRGRLDGMINTGGFHVYPAEVETALLSINGVKEASVRGEPNDDWGQIVVAQAVLDDAESLTPSDIREALGWKLAKYKLPKRIEIVADIT